MKITTIQAVLGSAILLLNAQLCAATTGHTHHHLHLEKKHGHIHSHGHGLAQYNSSNPKYSVRNSSPLASRDGKKKCQFPSDKGLVAVTPSGQNGGWAMAPDQQCVSGTWCPFACPSGQVMAQWKPGTTYAYPESTYGGIYCNDGEIEVPFKDKDWCVDGTGTVAAVNKAGKVVSFCQTCLPGYEDMIIPNDVAGTITLAVPGTSYWDSTAAHYYINAPGVDASQGCHWGDESKAMGNWSPFVAGANTVADGSTYVKLGINPVWQSSSLYGTKPTFGLKVECPQGGCNGAKCQVDGSGVTSDNKASGAGGGDFCVVTVPSGGKANIVVYNLDGSGGDSGSSSSSLIAPTSLTQAPTSISITSISSVPSITSVSSTPSLTPPVLSSSSAISTSSKAATTAYSLSSRHASSIASTSATATASSTAYRGGVFQENGTSTLSFSSSDPSSTSAPVSVSSSGEESASSETNKNEGAGQRQGGAAMAGLVVAFVAATYLL
ncbi:hypothetical protein F4781DRAFT_20208 [Annulohypoxylon bovei var. microspora]|nr:hypothetical protein F4781DRAFT_20208 [Annulohypoxylon bovei var. microspora]